GQEFERMDPAARARALEAAITRFQHSDQGQALITQIREDNAADDPARAGRDLYVTRPLDERVADFGPDHPGHEAPTAGYAAGAVGANDVTMQALANAWPQHFFGRMLDEDQAYHLLQLLVTHRGLPFNEAGTNVVGMRAFQGEIHDNGEGGPGAPGA